MAYSKCDNRVGPLALCRAMLAICAAICVSLATPVRAETARGVFQEWLATFNSGDKAAIQKFYGQRLDDSGALFPRHLRAETCGFDVARVERETVSNVSVLLSQRCAASLWRLTFKATGKSGKLEDFELKPFAMADSRAIAATRDIAVRLAKLDEFAGSILIARTGQDNWTFSTGSVSRQDATAIGVDTPMFLASAGKMFTGVSILQLVEAGKVELDAPLSRYLPDYPNAAMARVTIRQLLSHRGGTGEEGVLRREDVENRKRVRTIDDFIALNGNRAPAFPPGSKADYSNYGFILLGAVIERVSGQSYQDYVRKNIFDRAGMTRAGFPDKEHLQGVPVGYTTFFETEAALLANTDVLPWRGSAAGGGVASAGDMLRFFAALRSGKLLSRQSLAMATTPGDTDWYGLGFIAQSGDQPLWGHGGGSYGMSVAAQHFPRDGATFICLATRDMACDRLINAWFSRRFGLDE